MKPETFEELLARKVKERKAREDAERRRIYSGSSDYTPERFEPIFYLNPERTGDPTPTPNYDSPSVDYSSDSGSFGGGESGGAGASDSW